MTDDIFELLKAKMPAQSALEIPPKIFTDMGGEIIDYIKGISLTVRFPVKERYQNPLGSMQGGMIVAAIDNTFGPLCYLEAPPSVTTHINTTYIRPITADQQHITVTANVVEITKRQIHMRAEIKNEAGKIVAISHSSNYFVNP
jgi:uncharacterized protein (TIGR00369 family)